MANILNKLRGAMLGESYDDEDYDYDYEDEEESVEEHKIRSIDSARGGGYSRRNNGNSSKVVNIHTNVQMEVVVTAPVNLEEAGEVCDYLKAKKTVIVNLENIEHEIAQRISDFLCGACYALDGSIQLISDDIFIIGPVNVDITGQFKEELKANGIKLPYTSMWR